MKESHFKSARIFSIRVIVTASFFPIFSCAPSLNVETDRYDLVIRNVDVFDSRSGLFLDDQSIFIDDGVIAEIQPASPDDSAIEIVDGAGRLAVPGLIDSHVHLQFQFDAARTLLPEDRERLARVYLDHGVTLIAEMGQPPAWVPTLVDWQNAAGPGPDLVLVAGSLNSRQPWDTNPPPHHVILESPEEARAQVRRYHELGAERIKLYWKLEEPEMAAAMETAMELGVTPYAHFQEAITIPDALDAGVRHFEHGFTLQYSVASGDSLNARLAEDFELGPYWTLDEWTLAISLYFLTMNEDPQMRADLDALIARMAEGDASLSTALNIVATAAGRSPVFSAFEPRPLRSAPDIRDSYRPSDEIVERGFDAFISTLVRAQEAGVLLRIGTDAANGGEATRAEMMLLNQAGLPVEDVLQIATINGASALGVADRAGILDVGRNADIVLFHEDPRLDPAAFLGELTVYQRGERHDPSPSFAAVLGDILASQGTEAASARWDSRGDARLSPMEVYFEIMELARQGLIDEVAFLVDRLESAMNGEPVSAYLDPVSLNTVGYELIGDEDIESAVRIFQLAVRLHPDAWYLHDSLGEAQALAGDVEAAITSYERSVELYPDSRSGPAALERLRARQTP